MSKLKELEKRLRDEPDNLGLRVMVAGALHDAGRRSDAVELYRSVAIAYRDQGRPQQAITVCRSILELAPDDGPCTELLAALMASQAAPREEPRPRGPSPDPPARLSPPGRLSPPPGRLSPPPSPRSSPPPSVPRPSPLPLPRPSEPSSELLGEPRRRSSGDVTPLPQPLPYHLADPTTSSMERVSRSELPQSWQDELAGYPEIAGIANAARQISASLIAASPPDDDDFAFEPDTGRVRRTAPGPSPSDPLLATDVDRLPPTGPGDDDDPTLPPRTGGVPRSREDEKTEPRELPGRARPPSILRGRAPSPPAEPAGPLPPDSLRSSIAPATTATGPLASAFFATVPPQNRTAVLQRFRRRMAATGMTVIRRGESNHGLVLVVRGRLELHGVRSDGSHAALGAIGPGDYIGEASLLAHAPAAVHVVAATECEILVLGAADFYEVTAAYPALWAELEDVADRRARDHAGRLG